MKTMNHSEDFKEFISWLKKTAPVLSEHLYKSGLDSILPTYWLLYKNSKYDPNKPEIL